MLWISKKRFINLKIWSSVERQVKSDWMLIKTLQTRHEFDP